MTKGFSRSRQTADYDMTNGWPKALCRVRDPRGNKRVFHIRGHWGLESRDHNRRDCTLLEDKTRSRNANVVGNLAVARAALLFFNSRTKDGHLGDFADACREDRAYV